MKAIVITEFGGPEVLKMQEVTTPAPGKGEVLVAVEATAVNRLDLLQRMGRYPAPPGDVQDIPGVEYAGVVAALGEGVTNRKIGDRVFGLVGGGSYAEYLVIPAEMTAKIPDGVSFEEAAAIPEAFVTAYDAMVSQAELCAGQTVLISAVGSGVGVAAVQIARAIGAKSIGTARTASKLEAAKVLGLETGIEVKEGKFSDAVLQATDACGVDVVLELAGGRYVSEDIACMAPRGRLMLVGLVAGAATEIDLGMILRKRLTIKGTTLRARAMSEKMAVMKTFATEVVPLIAEGKLKAVIDRTFSLTQASEAHQYVAANENFGKVVLKKA